MRRWGGHELVLVAGLFAAGCNSSCNSDALSVRAVERAMLATGVELVTATVVRGGASVATVRAIYAEPSALSTRVVINRAEAPLSELAPNALAVLNAGFFTPERKPTGLLVSGGKVHNALVPAGGAAGSGVVLIEGGVVSMLERDKIAKGRAFDRASLALQAGPRLIENGGRPGIRSDDGERAHRTAIGADATGRLVVAVVRGTGAWTSGPPLFELQQILGVKGLGAAAKDLELVFALNLDGGPSTGMHVRHREHGFDAPEAAPVYSALAVEVAR